MSALELYGDILCLSRPAHHGDLFSRRHPQMTCLNRAKLFAPFAALAGFDGHIRAQEVEYEPRRRLSREAVRALNDVLRDLSTRRGTRVRVEYFEPCTDRRAPAFGSLGLTRTVTGTLRTLDPYRLLVRVDDVTIPFQDLYSMEEQHGG